MTTTLPVVMCMNEERFIERVLIPFVQVFPVVVIGDTGSTDSTLDIITQMQREYVIYLVHYPHPTPEELGLIRMHLQDIAAGFGATHALHLDGDEIYPSEYVRYIYDNPIPNGMNAGLITGEEIAELPSGEWWKYAVRFSKVAVIPCGTRWHGSYPLERIDTLLETNPELNYYWPSVHPLHQFYHLHTMRRSSRDRDAYARLRKQNQFCQQDRPDMQPREFWLRSEDDYKDGV